MRKISMEMWYRVLLSLVVFWSQWANGGFIAHTEVKTLSGYTRIDHIRVGDCVMGIDRDGNIVSKKVLATQSYVSQRSISVTINGEIIVMAAIQKIYMPKEGVWKQAMDLKVGDTLLNNSHDCGSISHIELSDKRIVFFDLSVDGRHNFFVSKNDVLVHNFVPIVIGISLLFGSGAIEFVGATIGIAFLGTAIGLKLYKNRDSNSVQKDGHGGLKITFNGSPEDPDNKRKENTVSKSDFFKKVKDKYEYWQDGVYKRKPNAEGIADAEYLVWDRLHNDVEAYSASKKHIGSIDPQTLRIYKSAVPARKLGR